MPTFSGHHKHSTLVIGTASQVQCIHALNGLGLALVQRIARLQPKRERERRLHVKNKNIETTAASECSECQNGSEHSSGITKKINL